MTTVGNTIVNECLHHNINGIIAEAIDQIFSEPCVLIHIGLNPLKHGRAIRALMTLEAFFSIFITVVLRSQEEPIAPVERVANWKRPDLLNGLFVGKGAFFCLNLGAIVKLHDFAIIFKRVEALSEVSKETFRAGPQLVLQEPDVASQLWHDRCRQVRAPVSKLFHFSLCACVSNESECSK